MTKTSPSPTSASAPSSIRTRKRPCRQYPLWWTWQLGVPASGPIDSDQRQPGSKVAMANSNPVMLSSSRCPSLKSRRSSGLSTVLTSIMKTPRSAYLPTVSPGERGKQDRAGKSGARLRRNRRALIGGLPSPERGDGIVQPGADEQLFVGRAVEQCTGGLDEFIVVARHSVRRRPRDDFHQLRPLVRGDRALPSGFSRLDRFSGRGRRDRRGRLGGHGRRRGCRYGAYGRRDGV